MVELEIHHETHEHDPAARMVGIMAAVISVFLAVVTIYSHRMHTEGVLLKTDANDKWSYYQAQRMKFHNLELGEDILSVLPKSTEISSRLVRYSKDKVKYEKRSQEAQVEAGAIEAESKKVEDRALRFDFGEGLLEIGLVMTSMFFISKAKLFPVMGIIAAVAGVAFAIIGFLL